MFTSCLTPPFAPPACWHVGGSLLAFGRDFKSSESVNTFLSVFLYSVFGIRYCEKPIPDSKDPTLTRKKKDILHAMRDEAFAASL